MKLELQEPFKSKWKRAYLRTSKDSRKRVDLVNSNKDRTTISYARYLISVNLGYELGEEFEVDHIDTDCSNDNLSNLQILTKEEHLRKTISEKPSRAVVELICPNCGKLFTKFVNQMRTTNPKCSRRCNAIYNRNNGKWLGQSRKGQKKVNKNLVIIGIEAGAFSITINETTYRVDQEDDPSVELEKLFKSLGYKVQINEDW